MERNTATIDGREVGPEFVPVEMFSFTTYLDARRKLENDYIFDKRFESDPSVMEMRDWTDRAAKTIAEKYGYPFTIAGLTALAESLQGPYFVVVGTISGPLRVTDAGKIKCEVILARERMEAKGETR